MWLELFYFCCGCRTDVTLTLAATSTVRRGLGSRLKPASWHSITCTTQITANAFLSYPRCRKTRLAFDGTISVGSRIGAAVEIQWTATRPIPQPTSASETILLSSALCCGGRVLKRLTRA